MIVPNWQHNSEKKLKRTLKPQALRAAKKRTKTFIRKLTSQSNGKKETLLSE